MNVLWLIYIAGDGLGYRPGRGIPSCTEIGSRDPNPSLGNVNMPCIIQCTLWVWNPNPSLYRSSSLSM